MRGNGVLMVVGAYSPEVSGGGLQCRELVRALNSEMPCTILSVSADFSLPRIGEVDGVPVYRIPVDTTRLGSKMRAATHLAWTFIRLRRRFSLVHFHGFSEKTILLTLLSKLLRTRTLLTLHTADHDEPASIRAKGRLAFWCYAQVDCFVGVSPYLHERYLASRLPEEKFRLIPGGIDLRRFHPPADPDERRRLRQELRLPDRLPLILFVGFFSHDKRPRLLFDAWSRLQGDRIPPTGLVFVGATRSPYFEVDAGLADAIRAEARRLGLADRVRFVEATHEIEKFYRAVDLFVLPSARESMSMALVEAMASGLPCIASRLPGVTDRIIDHGVNGILVPSGDVVAMEGALRALLEQPEEARVLGRRARTRVEERYSMAQTAARYLQAYRALAGLKRLGGAVELPSSRQAPGAPAEHEPVAAGSRSG